MSKQYSDICNVISLVSLSVFVYTVNYTVDIHMHALHREYTTEPKHPTASAAAVRSTQQYTATDPSRRGVRPSP